MEEKRFCTRCGANLSEGASFCSECGSSVNGDASPRADAAAIGRCPSFAVLFLLYGAFATILGALDAVSNFSLTETGYNELINELTSMTGIDMSELYPPWSDDMPLRLGLSMAFMSVSGLLSIGCYFMCKIKMKWKESLILCAASSVSCLGMLCSDFYGMLGVLMFVIGMLFTILLYTSKNRMGARSGRR